MSFKNQFCPKPFEYLDIHYVNGQFRCYMCCPTWLPINIGDIQEKGLKAIWNGELAREVRKSILNESFLYCNPELCPEIQSENLHNKDYIYKKEYLEYLPLTDGIVPHGPRIVYFSEDRTCNLACPSCRKDYISIPQEDIDHILKIREGFLPDLMSSVESLNICSSGDPFASQIYRDFLFNLEGSHYPQLIINLNTNGVLLNQEAFERMVKIHSNLGSLYISLDAATKNTYDSIRKGGDWEKVLENIKYLSTQRKRGRLRHLQLDFVVQDSNFHEMPAFVELGTSLGVDKVYFQRISNWGTYSINEYKKKNMADPTHPQYQRFLDICKHPQLRSGLVKKGNLQSFIPKGLKDQWVDFLKKLSWIRKLRNHLLKALH